MALKKSHLFILLPLMVFALAWSSCDKASGTSVKGTSRTRSTRSIGRTVNVPTWLGKGYPAQIMVPSGWVRLDWKSFSGPRREETVIGVELARSAMHGTDDVPETFLRFRSFCANERLQTPEQFVAGVVTQWRKNYTEFVRGPYKLKKFPVASASFYTYKGQPVHAAVRRVDVGAHRYILVTAIANSANYGGSKVRPIYIVEAECDNKAWGTEGKKIQEATNSIRVPDPD